MAGSTRTPKSRALGAAIRESREALGWSQRKLASAIDRNSGIVSRWESGDRAPAPTDVAQMLTVLGVTGERYDEILEMTTGTDDSRWLATTLPDQRGQLKGLLECERTATRITHVAPLLIPGVLQTSDYARAIMTAGAGETDEVETRVMVRIGRRDLITRSRPAELQVYLGEAAVRHVIGGRTIITEQLRYLLELAELDNVTVQVVPYDSGWHAGLEGMFMLIESQEDPPVVHLENRKTGLFLHEEEDLASYRAAVDSVAKVAMSPGDSAELIAEIANRMETT